MKVSIRDVLFATTCAALSLGWLLDHWRLTVLSRSLETENIRLVLERDSRHTRPRKMLEPKFAPNSEHVP